MDNEGYCMSIFSSTHPRGVLLIFQNSGPGVLISESCSATIKGKKLKNNELGIDMANPWIEAIHDYESEHRLTVTGFSATLHCSLLCFQSASLTILRSATLRSQRL
jgi:hypothetical protein